MRIAIVEDEAVVARRLIRALEGIMGDQLERITHLSRLAEAERHLREEPVDLLFLDLNLNGASGFDLLKRAVASPCQTVIVSAHDDQAIKAFEYGVVDFVAKPYTNERLAQALARAREREASLRDRLKYLAVREGGEVRMIPIAEVLYLKGAGDYSEVHVDGGQVHLHDKTLRALDVLLPDVFLRVHRSYIVHRGKVEGFRSEPGSRYALRLKDGTEVPVSRAKLREVRAMFA